MNDPNTPRLGAACGIAFATRACAQSTDADASNESPENAYDLNSPTNWRPIRHSRSWIFVFAAAYQADHSGTRILAISQSDSALNMLTPFPRRLGRLRAPKQGET